MGLHSKCDLKKENVVLRTDLGAPQRQGRC